MWRRGGVARCGVWGPASPMSYSAPASQARPSLTLSAVSPSAPAFAAVCSFPLAAELRFVAIFAATDGRGRGLGQGRRRESRTMTGGEVTRGGRRGSAARRSKWTLSVM